MEEIPNPEKWFPLTPRMEEIFHAYEIALRDHLKGMDAAVMVPTLEWWQDEKRRPKGAPSYVLNLTLYELTPNARAKVVIRYNGDYMLWQTGDEDNRWSQISRLAPEVRKPLLAFESAINTALQLTHARLQKEQQQGTDIPTEPTATRVETPQEHATDATVSESITSPIPNDKRKKNLSGRPRNADDEWARQQVHELGRNKQEVFKEWKQRIGDRAINLADLNDSFDKVIGKKPKE